MKKKIQYLFCQTAIQNKVNIITHTNVRQVTKNTVIAQLQLKITVIYNRYKNKTHQKKTEKTPTTLPSWQ